MSVLDKSMYRLPATKTYARREVEFIPVNEHEFILIITRSVREFRGRAKLNRDVYHCQPEPAVGTMGRVFLCLKTTDIEVAEPYRVAIGPHGNACTCKAGVCRVPGDDDTDGCCHRDALSLLILEGEI